MSSQQTTESQSKVGRARNRGKEGRPWEQHKRWSLLLVCLNVTCPTIQHVWIVIFCERSSFVSVHRRRGNGFTFNTFIGGGREDRLNGKRMIMLWCVPDVLRVEHVMFLYTGEGILSEDHLCTGIESKEAKNFKSLSVAY